MVFESKDTITGIFQEGVSNFCYTPGFTLERRWLVIVTHAKILRKWIRGSWTCNGLGVKIANICPALVWPPAHVVWCEETVAPDLQRRLVLDSYLEMVTAQGCSRWAQRVFLALIELAPFLKSDKEPDQEHLLPWVVLPAARFGTGMPVRSPPILDLKPSALDVAPPTSHLEMGSKSWHPTWLYLVHCSRWPGSCIDPTV